ncbi:hypothetical protein [Streptomyces boninensis]
MAMTAATATTVAPREWVVGYTVTTVAVTMPTIGDAFWAGS